MFIFESFTYDNNWASKYYEDFYSASMYFTNYLNIINTDVEFKDWSFGHYHDDKNFGKYHMLYNTIINIV